MPLTEDFTILAKNKPYSVFRVQCITNAEAPYLEIDVQYGTGGFLDDCYWIVTARCLRPYRSISNTGLRSLEAVALYLKNAFNDTLPEGGLVIRGSLRPSQAIELADRLLITGGRVAFTNGKR